MMVAVQTPPSSTQSKVATCNRDVEQAWNTIYNVLHLNRLAYDPEDAARSLRHPLITILEHCQNDHDGSIVDYLGRNEVLIFLATCLTSAQQSVECGKVVIAFFAYLCQVAPVKTLVNREVADAIQIARQFDIGNSILAMLLPRLEQHVELRPVYIADSLIRDCLEPILASGDIYFTRTLIHIIDDHDYGDLATYTKALAVLCVNAVMDGDEGVRVIRVTDGLFEGEHCAWTQFRVSFVESFRRHCVDVLAETDPKLLKVLFEAVREPELLVPVGAKLLEKCTDFGMILEIADRVPNLVFSQDHGDLLARFQSFPIDRTELAQVIDKFLGGPELYKHYHTLVNDKHDWVSLKPAIRKLAMDTRVAEGSPLEQLLLKATPIPVCMPASPRLCAYYLAFLQRCRLGMGEQ